MNVPVVFFDSLISTSFQLCNEKVRFPQVKDETAVSGTFFWF